MNQFLILLILVNFIYCDVNGASDPLVNDTSLGKPGSCREFLKQKKLDKCTTDIRDKHFIRHYETICYCDATCNTDLYPESNMVGCCSDYKEVCLKSKLTIH
jgi:hypothetical protein